MSTPVSVRLSDEALAALDAKAEAAGQARGPYVLALLTAHVGGSDPAPVAAFTPQHPTKAAPGAQVWHPGGLKAELQDLANKRGVDLSSLLAGCAALELDMRPSPRPRPLTSLPKAAAEPARPRR